MYKMLVLTPVTEAQLLQLSTVSDQVLTDYEPSGKTTKEKAAEYDFIFGNISPDWLPDLPRLKWLQLNSAGSDKYAAAAGRPGLHITNASGAYGLAISEHMLGMVLMRMKHLDFYHDRQHEHAWKDGGHVTSIFGSHTLVLGLGDIGQSFALRMHALGSEVHGIRRRPGACPEGVSVVLGMDALEKELAWADIIALSLPESPATRQLINAERLALMKPTAILVNVGRGSAIDSLALARALEEGRLGGACLDVTDPEPLPAEHPLWDAPGALITPHVSGQYHLPETLVRIVSLTADNLKRFLAGQPLRNEVDPATGYRREQAESPSAQN